MYVGRPTKWGNPFTVQQAKAAGNRGTEAELREVCVDAFRAWLTCPHGEFFWMGPESDRRRAEIRASLPELRGRHLMCWCPEGQKCHADVLMELANA